ncbi:heavy metal translocating P-type ATPase [Fusobacterium varium]|jgi:Cu+-exporting ATPase|uniref:Cadmium-translocating P-type ATPase n=1 Tax=Fusobacterium varium ATCC 27725 TaxID=469618 RepID=A0ABM6U491_FUSVA|nr:heavy metal translocating P-type ATPase [Fusobacterium varium]AVQ31145.1 cadmium-translocating P-type ATPase [Fusobacterium varium ATCC 27725]EES62459.1 copper-exporting ATPase [Fusobacterium varium ATCC 27725]VEH40165.1 Copper-exporting P-type ATPase A [Fusobacterium varium]
MKKNYQLGGISCQVCVNKIEKKLSKLEGMKEAVVNLSTEKLSVDYDETILKEETIIETVKKLGYEIEEESELKDVELDIDGISCQVCVNKIEKKVSKLNGVKSVIVNLASSRGKIVYDSDVIKLSEILEVMKKMGYTGTKHEESSENLRDKEKEEHLKREFLEFKIAIIFSAIVFYIAMGTMIGLPVPAIISPDVNPLNFAIVQFILALPVVYIGRRFYIIGIKQLFMKSPSMDSLIATGTGSALIYSIYGTFKIAEGDYHYVHSLYFESAVVILALILLGKYLEGVSKGKTSEAIKKLMSLKSKKANLVRNGEIVQVDIEEVEKGEVLLVKPGESIPVDGKVIDGNSTVDESMLTGESIPMDKAAGDIVYGASINKNGSLKIEATAVGKDTVISKIIKLVENAQGSKAPIAKIADKVSAYFVPIVMLIATAAGIIWYFLGSRGIVEINNTPSIFALTIFISVMVIACPCSLGLATPTAIMVGTGRGAELGILIKSGEALEKAHKVNAVVFDKTGTLTEGKPRVTDILTMEGYKENDTLQIAGALEQHSEHPLGEAIVEEAKERGLVFPQVTDFISITGQGVYGKIEESEVLIGNIKLMKAKNIEITMEKELDELASQGKTPMYMAIDGKFLGIIAVADVMKKEAVDTIKELKTRGYKIGMITGDNKITAEAIGKQVGIDMIFAEVTPEDKYLKVKELQNEGYNVAMVGDGINDSPALVQADVGIAIGGGTDIAMESADIVLMKRDLRDVLTAMDLSNATIRNIKQNLFWAFIYNTLGIPIAAGLLYPFTGHLLNPMIAGGAMAMSSVSVVTNALRLKKFKKQ